VARMGERRGMYMVLVGRPEAKGDHLEDLGLDEKIILKWIFNPLNPELNPICYLLALLAHHFLHVSRIRVKSLTIRLLMSYIYIWSAYS